MDAISLYPETSAHSAEHSKQPNVLSWWSSRDVLEFECDVEDPSLQVKLLWVPRPPLLSYNYIYTSSSTNRVK